MVKFIFAKYYIIKNMFKTPLHAENNSLMRWLYFSDVEVTHTLLSCNVITLYQLGMLFCCGNQNVKQFDGSPILNLLSRKQWYLLIFQGFHAKLVLDGEPF